MSDIFLLTGWGVGEQCLAPLAEALTQLSHRVIVKDLPYLENPYHWFMWLDEQLPESAYWVGWSLGGQLLSEITAMTKKQCLGLVTLASNVSFTVKPSWPYAMDNKVFDDFEQRYHVEPEQTLKQFWQLVAQGASSPKVLFRSLQQNMLDRPILNAEVGLSLLATLDTRLALKRFVKPQYHVLAEQDALVPATCVAALKSLLPKARVECVEKVGHAFVMQEQALLAYKIDQFIKASHETQ